MKTNQEEITCQIKKTIYFLCTGNSCRSQMAEGGAKTHLSDEYNIIVDSYYFKKEVAP